MDLESLDVFYNDTTMIVRVCILMCEHIRERVGQIARYHVKSLLLVESISEHLRLDTYL